MKITICGSAKFEPMFHEWSKRLVLGGHTCYSLAVFPSTMGEKNWYTDEEKTTLDLVHLSKIEESDGILIINQDGYVGESLRKEIEWARIRGKLAYWVEFPADLRDLRGGHYKFNECGAQEILR